MLEQGRLLIIDDDRDFCADLVAVFSARMRTVVAYDPATGFEEIERNGADVVLLDLDFGQGQMEGLDALEHILGLVDPPLVIMLSGSRDMQTVVQAVKLGAYHYVTKPADVSQIDNLIRQALKARQGRYEVQALQAEVGRLTGNFIAGDDKTLRLLEKIAKVAPTNATVLITGESGTGKEMIARRIHAVSNRSAAAFVGVNCGAFPADLIEAEIFGHAQGAYTGATKMRVGKIELAADGILFLDEIGESPDPFQVKLLRALGELVFNRLGENRDLTVSARILAATSENLEQAIRDNHFRESLYYRLNRYRIEVPPLRERRGDIEPLAQHFLRTFCQDFHKQIDGFSPGVMARFMTEPWVGNVRELRNLIERAVIDCEGHTICLGNLSVPGRSVGMDGNHNMHYKQAKVAMLAAWEKTFFAARLQETDGNVTLAAENCGMARQQLQKKLRDLGIAAAEFR